MLSYQKQANYRGHRRLVKDSPEKSRTELEHK